MTHTIVPFVKWSGGKTKIASLIAARVPRFKRYFEPFLGGGAAFLAVRQAVLEQERADELNEEMTRIDAEFEWACLNDVNAELVNAYERVKDESLELFKMLELLQQMHETNPETTYASARRSDPQHPMGRASRFIYLNKTCFNGLYRVNRQGKFNVPMGRFKTAPKIAVLENLQAWSEALKVADLNVTDFGTIVSRASRGDFIYCDPPYLPRSKTADFTSYTAARFTLDDHRRLADVLRQASDRGAMFLLSQGDSATIRALYNGFRIESIAVQHSVGAKGSSRGKVAELLISNYPLPIDARG